jgi:Zn-dependent peptidase ImmA (M78 family)
MISIDDAVELAGKYFPNAPEKIAEQLGVIVRESPMDGCDGWCLTSDDRTIIRINSRLYASSRRFTLAHELAHLILGVPTVVGESYQDMLGSDSEEERRVNDLAANILLPRDVVTASLPNPPVVAAALKALAKKARVSQLAAAVRVCNLANDIGLVNASVVLFDDGNIRWQWSPTLQMTNDTAAELLEEARKVSPNAFRKQRSEGDVVVASTIENPFFGSATLFVQLLPENVGLSLSHHELRKQLEEKLFRESPKLQQRVSGLMGAHKARIQGLSLEAAVDLFWQRNSSKLNGTSLDSDAGHEYVRLRIGEWV